MSPQSAAHTVGQGASAESCTWLEHDAPGVPRFLIAYDGIVKKLLDQAPPAGWQPRSLQLGDKAVLIYSPDECKRERIKVDIVLGISGPGLDIMSHGQNGHAGGAYVLICAKNDLLSSHTNTKEAK